MYRRLCAMILAASFIVPNLLFIQAAERKIDIGMARDLAKENSSSIRNVVIDNVKKRIELKQAQDAIKDIRKAENTIRFSLLFNIKFPEKHGLPKEIELVMRVPEINSEIDVLEKKEIYETLKVETDTEIAFYDVLLSEYKVQQCQEVLSEAKKTLISIEKQYKSGSGKKEDVDYVKNKIKNYETEYKNHILNLESKKKKLGDKINIDTSLGYTFTEYLPQATIKRADLPKIMEYAKANDFKLYEAVQARKIAQQEVNALLSIYNSQYSKYIGSIRSYIASNRNGTMDYKKFLQLYDYTLMQMDSPWDGTYNIFLLFFTLKIPKEWFKGTYSGTRYLEDQKYALFIALVEEDKKKQEEEAAVKELEERVYDAYESLKIMERAYAETKDNLSLAEKNYANSYKENKIGLIDFTMLESMKESLYNQQKSLYEMRIDYAVALSSFDLYTGGYIRKRLIASGEEGNNYESGISLKDESEVGSLGEDKPSWYLNTNVTEYNFIFGVRVPPKYDVTHYELHYDGNIVGSRMPINETINHLPLTYNDNSVMTVMLYKEKELKYTAFFDGGDFSGDLELKSMSPEEQGSKLTIVGLCTVSYMNELMSRFSVTLNDDLYNYDSYSLWYKDTEIARKNKGETIETLNMYFANIELVTLKIYKDDNQIKIFDLQQDEKKQDVTIGVVIDRGGI